MDIWNINGKKGTVVPTGEDGDELIPIKKTVSKGHDQSHIVGTSGMGAGGFGSNDAKKKKEKSKKRVEMEEKVAAILKKHAAVGGTLDAVQLSALVQHELALSAPRSRMENRSNAIKMLTGQRQMHGQPSKDARAAMKSLKDNGGIEGGGKGSKSNDLMWGMKAHSVISVGKVKNHIFSDPIYTYYFIMSIMTELFAYFCLIILLVYSFSFSYILLLLPFCCFCFFFVVADGNRHDYS